MKEKILPKSTLELEYSKNGLNDREIALKHGLTGRDVSRLRNVYGIPTRMGYLLHRNSLRFVPFTRYQEQFLYGTLLGDSCIAVQKSGTGYWVCRHSIKQEKYLLKKVDILKPFISKVSYGHRSFDKQSKSFPYIDGRSKALPQFTKLREELYPKGKKIITSQWLSKITPVGFAYWFMDDGSISGSGYSFIIRTFDPYFRTPEALDILRKVLGLSVTINWDVRGNGSIYVLQDSVDLAWSYIKPELSVDLRYKIPEKYK